MIKIEKTEVHGWEAAIRGMRNPKNSWDKSDSHFNEFALYILGQNDLSLMRTLSNAGDDHGKVLRFINVTVDITAPLYWWKEFDTYKVGTVANSCSTMHKVMDHEFTINDFSFEEVNHHGNMCIKNTLYTLNFLRNSYINESDPDLKKEYWKSLIQLLPSSFNQKRTVQLNYQVLKRIYYARKDHKLKEWHEFCDWIKELPHAQELFGISDKKVELYDIKPGQWYKSYIGNTYYIISVAKYTETNEKLVIYSDTYGNSVYAMPIEMFCEKVCANGQEMPRFRLIVETEIN